MNNSNFYKLISFLEEATLKKRLFFISTDDEGYMLRYKRQAHIRLTDYLWHLKLKYKDNKDEIASLEDEIMSNLNSYFSLQFNVLKYLANGKLEYNDSIDVVLADYCKLIHFDVNNLDNFFESDYGKHCDMFIEKFNVLLFDIYNKRIKQNIDVFEINTSGDVEEVFYSYFLNFGVSLCDTVDLGDKPRVTVYDVDICMIYHLDMYIVLWRLKEIFAYFFDYLLDRIGYDHDKHIGMNHLLAQHASSYTLDLVTNSYSYLINGYMREVGYSSANVEHMNNVFMECKKYAESNIYDNLNSNFTSAVMVGEKSIPFKLLKGLSPIVDRYKTVFVRYLIENSYQREYVVYENGFVYPIKESDITLDYIKEIAKSVSYVPYRSARYLEECVVRAHVEAALPEKICSNILYKFGYYPYT